VRIIADPAHRNVHEVFVRGTLAKRPSAGKSAQRTTQIGYLVFVCHQPLMRQPAIPAYLSRRPTLSSPEKQRFYRRLTFKFSSCHCGIALGQFYRLGEQMKPLGDGFTAYPR
jgi:hypothetical protein